MYHFSKYMFLSPNGSPMSFDVAACEHSDELKEYIEFGGGTVASPGPYTIILMDEEGSPGPDQQDVFLSKFIIQCCLKNEVLPLKEFRCNSPSLFKDEFDPQDVLLKRVTWEEAKKYLIANDERETSSSPSTSMSMASDATGPNLTKAQGPKGFHKPRRNEFTHSERLQILDIIVKAKAFDQLRGTAIWKRMNVKMQTHTWQSLKEHFHKKILPHIETYKIPSSDIQKIREGLSGSSLRKPPIYGAYSPKEDLILLNYVKKNAPNGAGIGGNVFWQTAEDEIALKDRTWQSMRERYLKYIRKNETAVLKSSQNSNTRYHDEIDSTSDEDCQSGSRRNNEWNYKSEVNGRKDHEKDQGSSEQEDQSKDNEQSVSERRNEATNCVDEESVNDTLRTQGIDVSGTHKRLRKLLPISRTCQRDLSQVTPPSQKFGKPSMQTYLTKYSETRKKISSPGTSYAPQTDQVSNNDQTDNLSIDRPPETKEAPNTLEESEAVNNLSEGSEDLFTPPVSHERTDKSSNDASKEQSSQIPSSSQSGAHIVSCSWPINFPPEIIHYVSEADSENGMGNETPGLVFKDKVIDETNVTDDEVESDWSYEDLHWSGVREPKDDSCTHASLLEDDSASETDKTQELCTEASSRQNEEHPSHSRKFNTSQSLTCPKSHSKDSKSINNEVQVVSKLLAQNLLVGSLELQASSSSGSSDKILSQDISTQFCASVVKVESSVQTDTVQFFVDACTQTDLELVPNDNSCVSLMPKPSILSSKKRSLDNRSDTTHAKVKRVSFAKSVANDDVPSPKYFSVLDL